MKKITQIFLSHLKVTTRNRQAFFFSIVFPLIFIGVFGLAFQESAPGNTIIPVGVINLDAGLSMPLENVMKTLGVLEAETFGDSLISIMHDVTFEDNQTKIFDITRYSDLSVAQLDLEKQKIHGLVLIPENFSTAMAAAFRLAFEGSIPSVDFTIFPNANFTTQVLVKGDQRLIDFSITSQVVEEIVKIYSRFEQDQIVPVQVQIDGDISSNGLTVFDTIVPGLLVFAILNNFGTVASISLSDVNTGMLSRLRLTKMRGYEYILGLIFSQAVLSLIQVPIMFGAAFIFGFPISISILYAFLFAALLSLSVSGMGILVAAFSRDSSAAGALSAIIGTPMAFLAGAFFEVPNPVLIPQELIGPEAFRLFDILPPTPAITAMRLILISGRDFAEVWFYLAILIFDSLLFLTTGIILYTKRHFNVE